MLSTNTRFTNIILVGLFLLTGVVFAGFFICQPRMYGLSGVYYNDPNWDGEPVFKVVDAEISSQTLQQRRAQLPRNIYTIQWTGYIVIPETGVYTFFTASDDGSYLLIDDNPVVDNGGVHGKVEKEGRIHLLKGLHAIKIRYLQMGGAAALHLFWQTDRMAKGLIPSNMLLPATIDVAGVWIYQNSRALLPYLLIPWGIVLVGLGLATFRILRQLPRKLLVEPLLFGWHGLHAPQVLSWITVVLYSLIIFLTLSYARKISQYMLDAFGNEIFSQITAVTLTLAGIGCLIYLFRLRQGRFPRLICFGMITFIYLYILSSSVRTALHSLAEFIETAGRYLESFDVYPIYAGEKVHFLEYGLLGILLCNALRYHLKNKLAYPLAIVIVYSVGLMDEGIQWALPNRVGEYRDIWLNIFSGTLAVGVVWLVIRPSVFRKHFQWSSLRPLCYVLAVAVVLTGIFLQAVHGFGASIFMPDSGTQFISVFPESRLIALDKQLLSRLEGKPADDLPLKIREMFFFEAQRHQHYRDSYYKQQRWFESYGEQEILKIYFRAYIRKHALKFFEYDVAQFVIPPDPLNAVFYASQAHYFPITAFSERAMWMTIATIAALLCFLATFGPASKTWVEHLLLRSLFAGIGIIVLILTARAIIPEKPSVRPNLLIITVDSCQPDYFSAYGYPKRTTPFFDQFASEGVLFSNAIAPSSWTIPSIVSLLTGVNPNVHGIDMRGKLMDQRIPALFELLEQQGYAIGDTSYMLTEPSVNSVFKKKEISLEAALGEGKSEESYLLSWLEAHRNQPFLAWTHIHTVHLPYNAPPPYHKLFFEPFDPQVLQDEEIKFVRSQLIIRKGEVEFDPQRHGGLIRTFFTQELRQQDAKLGKILMKLAELGLRENTIVVVTADHGEELLEHGFIGHASTSWDGTVYDDLIQVPLLIVAPRSLPKGTRIDAQVRIIDVMPTLLELLKIPLAAQIQGKSLLPLITGQAEFQETAFTETTPCGYSCPSRLADNRLRAVRTKEWKLIAKYDAETQQTHSELYHLSADPAETVNVIGDYPDVAKDLQQELQHWMDAPAQFPYQPITSDQPHYLDVDVEVRPIVLFPKVGTIFTPELHDHRILIKWIGDANAEYIIEYEVGQGGYHITGQIEVKGTEQWYGPYPDDIWRVLPLYNPWKFRILPKQYPQFPSEWMTFEMK